MRTGRPNYLRLQDFHSLITGKLRRFAPKLPDSGTSGGREVS
jgi:hypothetical protein